MKYNYGSFNFSLLSDDGKYLVTITDMRSCYGGTGYYEKTPRKAMINTVKYLENNEFSPRMCDRMKDAGKKVFPI